MQCKVWLLAVVFLLVFGLYQCGNPRPEVDDNEFAEFEDFDDEEDIHDEDEETVERVVPEKAADENVDTEEDDDDDDDATVETEEEHDEEFDHFDDDEEFEGFDKERGPPQGRSHEKLPDLQIAKVPLHLRTNWDSFYMEMLMLAGLGVYFLNFLAGKTKNSKLAQAWFNSHKDLLDSNFHIVGDDGVSKEAVSGPLIRESENVYTLWCSGRALVAGMLVEIKLLKRQDLVSSITYMLKPASDQIVITVDMDPNVMERFVFAVVQKRSSSKLHKELADLNQFTEKKNITRCDLPSGFQVLSEIGEASSAIMDQKVCHVLTKYDSQVEYIHFSDQYSGVKAQDDSQPQKMPERKSVLIFCFNVPGKGKTKTAEMEGMKPLLQLVFYCIEKVSRLQLSKEAKAKADRNRQKAEETFLKSAHSQRQEQAQKRREDKTRAEREKMMNEEDPDKARKWEERESRREMKRKQPKMKMMKI